MSRGIPVAEYLILPHCILNAISLAPFFHCDRRDCRIVLCGVVWDTPWMPSTCLYLTLVPHISLVYLPAGCSFGLDSPRGTVMTCCPALPLSRRCAAAGVPVPDDDFDAAARHKSGWLRCKWQWGPQTRGFLLSHNAHRYKGQSGSDDHPV